MALTNSVNSGNEGALRPYSKVVRLLLKRYEADDNIANMDNEVQSLRQEKLTLKIFAQQLRSKTLTCVSVYDEEDVKEIFAEGIQALIWKTLINWLADHQGYLLENLTQKPTHYLIYKVTRSDDRKCRILKTSSGSVDEYTGSRDLERTLC